jgi:hypothetical protein
MTQSGLWLSYGGSARIALAVILLTVAGGLAYGGTRLRRPVRLRQPGPGGTIFLLVAWGLALITFLACASAYVQQVRRDHITHAAVADPITPVTITAAVVLFLIVFVATPRGPWVRLTSGAIAAMTAPMIFELPFDLIIMGRIYPPVPPDPAFYRALFFVPLILVELTTLSLLTLTPMVRLFRPACYWLALMLLVFAVWALAGFGYPSAPVPIAMNVVSKLLAFVTVLSLFVPEWFTLRARALRRDRFAAAPDAARG